MHRVIARVGVRRPRMFVSFLSLGLWALAGCESPEAPVWEVGLRLPLTSDTLRIADLVRDGAVDTTADGVVIFRLEPKSNSMSYDLAHLCGDPCRALEGQTVAVPGFSSTDSVDVAFPQDLLSIDVRSARLSFSLTNGLNFDPLRPDPDPGIAGSITLATIDQETGTTLDTRSISGASQTLPPGTTLNVETGLVDVTMGRGLTIELTIQSPFDGQVATVDTSLQAGISALLDSIEVTAVGLVVDSDTVSNITQADLDGSIRQRLIDELAPGINSRVLSAAIQIGLTHNTDLEGVLNVSIAGSEDDLFSNSSDEVMLLDIDFSAAADGRVTTHEIGPQSTRFIAELAEVYVGYRAGVRGATEDSQGRPTARLTPTQQAALRLTFQVRVQLGN